MRGSVLVPGGVPGVFDSVLGVRGGVPDGVHGVPGVTGGVPGWDSG